MRIAGKRLHQLFAGRNDLGLCGIVTVSRNSVIMAEAIRNCWQALGSSSSLCYRLHSSDLIPDEESLAAFLLIGVRSQAMPTSTEMISNEAVR
jgi:hypothetical protein